KNGLPTLRWDQYTSLPPAPTVQLRLRSGDDALFHLFLAVNTQARPRHRIQPLEVQFLPARRAFPKTAFANPRKRVDHQLQLGAVGVALVEQKLLGIGVGGLVGDVLGGFFVGTAPVLLVARHRLHQLLLLVQQLLLELFELFALHRWLLSRTLVLHSNYLDPTPSLGLGPG